VQRPEAPALVLASGSVTRASLLRSTGLRFEIDPALVDETALKAAAGASPDPAKLAALLAEEKAKDVSRRTPDKLVIGGDQVLSLGGALLSKATSVDGARLALQRLSGQTHQLSSSVALAIGGEVVWSATDQARLTMRSLSAEALEAYLAAAGDALTTSVGAYQIEGLGITLFERIEGQHATILGLPLLPLLAELRQRDICFE
jgi:septum formation protein